MKELNSLDPRFRKDLNFIKREQKKAKPEALSLDKVQFGSQPLLAEQGDGVVSQELPVTAETDSKIAPDSTATTCLWEPTLLMEEHTPATPQTEARTLAEVTQELASNSPVVAPAGSQKPLTLGGMIGNAVSSLLGTPAAKLRKGLQEVDSHEAMALKLKTPEQFQLKKKEFQTRLEAGETLEQISAEATAVARRAAHLAQGKRPFDCQVKGALAMGNGKIAEMRTGEGKTLTAVLPLYLNALAGKGAHLVTVNDTLAANGAKDNKSTFELLGMSVGSALEGMSQEEKRQAYASDVTYVSNHTLGFDFLRDQTANSPAERVQRDPFYALVDEADEVFLEEAQTPLIISGQTESGEGEYQAFDKLAKRLKPGDDYRAQPEKNTVWLTESGMDWVETQLQVEHLDAQLKETTDPAHRKTLLHDMAQVEGLAHAIRLEQAAERAHKESDSDPALKKAYDSASSQRKALAKRVPIYPLYSKENHHRARFLSNALKANVLFHEKDDYLVHEDSVEIVDSNKGRTSEGRRFSNGLHQALEAKEGVTINPEQRTTASITYPNLFDRYERLAGMSGTAASSGPELYELYELEVVPIETNKDLARTDEPDIIFKTEEEKYAALARDAAKDFFSGRPVLIGTLSVEHNQFMVQQLLAQGVPEDFLQVLNAESVKGDKDAENEMIADAGRSGMVTVATNLAGRGANIKPDLINFKKISLDVSKAVEEGKPVVVELDDAKDAKWLAQWLEGFEPTVIGKDSRQLSGDSGVTIRVGKKGIGPADGLLINADSKDYETGGLTVYGTSRAESRRIDDQLIGRAGRQGDPGRSKFYLSLEDPLFQKHGGKGLKRLDALFTEQGQGLSGMLFSKVINSAQASAEATHAEVRKTTTKHDEVLHLQRKAYFGLRKDVVEGGPDIRQRFPQMAGEALTDEVFKTLPDKKTLNFGQIRKAVGEAEERLGIKIPLRFLDPELQQPDSKTMRAQDLEVELRDHVDRAARRAMSAQPDDQLRFSLLGIVDEAWSGHLDEMEMLKNSSQLQTYAQSDPEVFYKIQSGEVFKETMSYLNRGALKWVDGQAASTPRNEKGRR